MRRLARRGLAIAGGSAIGLAGSACRDVNPADRSHAIVASSHSKAQSTVNEIPGEPAEAQLARERLVHGIETGRHPWGGEASWDPRVMSAMRRVPRHRFVPQLGATAAYKDVPQPIGYGQTISQPTIVALMSQALRLTGNERVLEIGTGSAYQAAILSLLAREVYSIEIVEALGRTARARLDELGYRNVVTKVGDGYRGWPEKAPFDRIVLTAAPPEVPAALVEQLAKGGVLVAPVGERQQSLVRWQKRAGRLDKEVLGAVRFVPMVPAAKVPDGSPP